MNNVEDLFFDYEYCSIFLLIVLFAMPGVAFCGAKFVTDFSK